MAGNAEIDLPASPYRLLNALDEIGIKSTKEIVYQDMVYVRVTQKEVNPYDLCNV